jgi:uncharacterized DUF497 family protein
MNLTFEWDADKAKANLINHKVPFEYATRVFLDSLRRDGEDTREDYAEEERRITVGYIDLRLFVVVYTERNGIIRLISARKANAREQKNHTEALHSEP